MEKYRALSEGYGKDIIDSIEGDEPHFRLCEDERCPHLDKRGLCNIISNLGEEYLCNICRAHPRFYNDTINGKEAGLGMACEEAARIILSSDDYDKMTEIEEFCPSEEEYHPEFDTVSLREKIYSILAKDIPYTERLSEIEEAFGVSPSAFSDEEWQGTLSSLEYLNEDHKELFLCYSSDKATPEGAEAYLRRALAYFIYRNCSDESTNEGFRASVGFSLFCERLLASVIKEKGAFELESACDLARIISEEIEYSTDNTEVLKEEFYFI
jgi:lysine-N-methylase